MLGCTETQVHAKIVMRHPQTISQRLLRSVGPAEVRAGLKSSLPWLRRDRDAEASDMTRIMSAEMKLDIGAK